MMKLIANAALAAALAATGAWAADSQLPTAMLYVQVPFGGVDAKNEHASVGLKFGYRKIDDPLAVPSAKPDSFSQRPMLDMKLTGDGRSDFSVRGVGLARVQRALEKAGGTAPVERDPFAYAGRDRILENIESLPPTAAGGRNAGLGLRLPAAAAEPRASD